MQDLNDEWRPDLSKVLIRIKHDEPVGLVLQALETPLEVLTNQAILQLVGACVESSHPIFISVPTKKGYCHAMVGLNDNFQKAVESHELSQMQAQMARAINHGINSTTDPIQKNK